MKVVFLDFDGVVNTRQWRQEENGKWVVRYNLASDGVVNDCQAVQWLSEFCEKYGYDIVVTSSWRLISGCDCENALRKAGLRDSVKVVGETADLENSRNLFQTRDRSHEIADYLINHPEIENYLILDDEKYHIHSVSMTVDDKFYEFDLSHSLVLCQNGFLYNEFLNAACKTRRTRHVRYGNK